MRSVGSLVEIRATSASVRGCGRVREALVLMSSGQVVGEVAVEGPHDMGWVVFLGHWDQYTALVSG